MKLDRLILKNYRCFESLELSLHPNITVLVAENGQGKSTLLDAIRIGLWPYVHSFDLASSGYADPANAISVDDVRLVKKGAGDMVRQLPCEISLTGNYGDCAKTWLRFRESEKRNTKTKGDDNTKEMERWASSVQERVRAPEATVDLPMLGYYGTGRLWSHKKLIEKKTAKKNNDSFMRLFAYRDCLDPASSYKHFADWFTWIFESYREEQIKQLERNQPANSVTDKQQAIQVVQQATDCFLLETTGWHDLEYSVGNEKSLVLNHEQYGTMKVELLSDGIRSMLAMVGDIAYRCFKLNPHFGVDAANRTTGVVLIDEVDMHLHPRWQQLVLGQLAQAFPSIQFVVTTHSPQVLTTVKPECIRGIKWASGKAEVREFQFSEGAEAQQVLEDILGVQPRPQNLEVVKQLNEYLELIAKDQWGSVRARELRETLNAWGHGNETALIKADMDIRMRQYRRTQS